jgi:hypothetical protein
MITPIAKHLSPDSSRSSWLRGESLSGQDVEPLDGLIAAQGLDRSCATQSANVEWGTRPNYAKHNPVQVCRRTLFLHSFQAPFDNKGQDDAAAHQ